MLDAANATFWAELCGTPLARATGTTGTNQDSIKAFDRAYFEFYPYLADFIRFDELRGNDVLEVGLGYGSVSQRIVENGANFTGLDASHAPVAWLNHRMNVSGLRCRAVQGSILDAPFEKNSFDVVVSIGCFHHTGNMKRAVLESARVLRPGGRLVIMVYNAFSFHRWLNFPTDTIQYLASRSFEPLDLDDDGRRLFDFNQDGEACPATSVISMRGLRHMLKPHFHDLTIRKNNFARHRILQRLPRTFWLSTAGRLCGLDIYASALKTSNHHLI